MDINELRKEIDKIDDEMVSLYLKRMQVVGDIAKAKTESGSAVNDPERENRVLYRLTKDVPEEFRVYVKELYSAVFATSKAYQGIAMNRRSETAKSIEALKLAGTKVFPVTASVACQGVLGSNSYAAAKRLFAVSDMTYFKTFEGVFSAVAKGLCEYGVLPIENSTAGSVNEVYDLMKKYDFYIVKAIRLKIDHCLAAIKGAKKGDIKKVVSHPQALSQCGEFIKRSGLESAISENTATAARDLSKSGDTSVAVLCSKECAALYGLEVLEEAVQDAPSNYTRFICIGKKMEIFSCSNKISVMTSLRHEPGSLNKMLSRFAALGLDLTKIESRPINASPFEFMFYFDFNGNVFDDKIISLISELEENSDKFTFLGSYQEML